MFLFKQNSLRIHQIYSIETLEGYSYSSYYARNIFYILFEFYGIIQKDTNKWSGYLHSALREIYLTALRYRWIDSNGIFTYFRFKLYLPIDTF